MLKELLYQNKKIIYRVIGNGKPVILIHGFGEDSSVWKNQIEFLKNKCRLIIPDLPGSGQSEMINDMSMEGMAEVIKAIIASLPSEGEASPNPTEGGALNSDTCNVFIEFSNSKNPPSEGREACIIIGHSMGGYITLALVEKYPELVSAFGLFHSSAYADNEEKKATRRKGIEFINQHGAFEFLKTATPNLFSPKTKDERPGLIDEQVAGLDNFSSLALVSYYEAMMQRPDRTELLRKTTVPVLFIMGEYDNAVPMQDGLKQCHLPENSYIHILRRSGHMGMLEEPGISNETLEKFLSDI
ncbi:MAG: alpha/beta hydrolase [Chitinophagaceae bacterium]|nr:alpha/beta hydrolase [Chitinophagaceae bacterium]